MCIMCVYMRYAPCSCTAPVLSGGGSARGDARGAQGAQLGAPALLGGLHAPRRLQRHLSTASASERAPPHLRTSSSIRALLPRIYDASPLAALGVEPKQTADPPSPPPIVTHRTPHDAHSLHSRTHPLTHPRVACPLKQGRAWPVAASGQQHPRLEPSAPPCERTPSARAAHVSRRCLFAAPVPSLLDRYPIP